MDIIDWDEIKNISVLKKYIARFNSLLLPSDEVYLYAYFDGYNNHAYDNRYMYQQNIDNYKLGYEDGEGDRQEKKGT